MKSEDLKLIVKEKYGEIASQCKLQNQSSCCGNTGCCDTIDSKIFSDDYTQLKGYNADADLGLGCGIPTQYAGIEEGNSILDLGSGAGNDCFVARHFTGEAGTVTGLDFTDEMLEKANKNLKKTGFENVNFVKGDIEKMPLPDNTYDVVISNCVLNLVPDKNAAFSEIKRVLKTGGHFCISDVVLEGHLPENLKQAAELYVGCVSGAIQKEEYMSLIKDLGFLNVTIASEKQIVIPNSILLEYLSNKELEELKKSGLGIYSITVTANK